VDLLVEARTRRDPEEAIPPDLSPRALLGHGALRGRRDLVAGQDAVRRFFDGQLSRAAREGRDAFLLWGTFHDSSGQVAAFRRIIGPGGVTGLTHAVVEQFDADGAWQGIPGDIQRGDNATLTAYSRHGDGRAWRALERKQDRDDYTAWKYDYVPTVMDLLLAARAAGTPLLGCDMPRPLQNLADRAGSNLFRLREIHCLLALGDVLRSSKRPHRVAMLWGQDHVLPHGVPRFIPKTAYVLSVHLLGHRPGGLTPDAELGRKLAINDPVLLPLDASEEQVALLLPGPELAGEVDRAREWVDADTLGHTASVLLEARSEQPGTLFVRGKALPVRRRPRTFTLAAGPLAYVFRTSALTIAGALDLSKGGRVVLHFDPARRSTQIVQQAAYPPPGP
jgi:hypothetical protein